MATNSIRDNRLQFLTVNIFIILITAFYLYLTGTDWAGWFIFIYSGFFVLFSKTLRTNKKVFFSSLGVLLAHQGLSFMNTYITTLPGADKDALTFHNRASLIADIGNINLLQAGSDVYENLLALFYRIFGSSIFLGTQLSFLAFLGSLILIIKIAKEFNTSAIKLKYMILFLGLLPSVLLNTSVTLRESFQVFLLLAICYTAIKLKQQKSLLRFISLLFLLAFFGLWHNGFLILSPVLAFIIVYWAYKKRKVSVSGLIIGGVILAGSMFLLSTGIISTSATNALFSGDATQYAASYRMNSNLSARAAYGVQLDMSSVFGFITTYPQVLFSYFFAPFPWQISSPMDILAVLENLIRIWLIYGSYKTVRRLQGNQKSVAKFLLLLFFVVEGLWAVGTVNWGTAMRHHIVAYPLLLIVGGQYSFEIFIKNNSRRASELNHTVRYVKIK